ncbi:hypothetical protein N7463_006246 [Penicillium fimorum]|uniref:Uncharacterized protein n=1 Tax=Penicillium fimorum TaxID=1882269 RepID=A0A9W9XU01_9EURO|nr:hypothetical protein N7463_006246 [Penicillium fimorum]
MIPVEGIRISRMSQAGFSVCDKTGSIVGAVYYIGQRSEISFAKVTQNGQQLGEAFWWVGSFQELSSGGSG